MTGAALSFVAILGLGLTSCENDNVVSTVTPEVAPIAYTIDGTVLSGTLPASGVTVTCGTQSVTTTATGSFSFSVANTGSYILTFTKSGFVTSTSNVEIAAGAANGSGFTFNQSLIATAAPVTTSLTVATTIPSTTKNSSGATVQTTALKIQPADLSTVKQISSTDITASETVETALPTTSGEKPANLCTVSLQPAGIVFNNPVVLEIENPLEDAGVSFEGATLMKQVGNTWTASSDVTYNETSGKYEAPITSTANYKVVLPIDFTFTTAAVANSSARAISEYQPLSSLVTTHNYGLIANCGSNDVATIATQVTRLGGWNFKEPFGATLNTALNPYLNQEFIDWVETALLNVFELNLGAAPGVQENKFSFGVLVDGMKKYTNYKESQSVKYAYPSIPIKIGATVVNVKVDLFAFNVLEFTIVNAQEKCIVDPHTGGGGN